MSNKYELVHKSLCNCDSTDGTKQAPITIQVGGCCRLKPPPGFNFQLPISAQACYDLSNLTCLKTPIVKDVNICEDSVSCQAVVGYEIRLVGSITFAVSMPIVPIAGDCIKKQATFASCFETVPFINETLACTCSPAPCTDLKCLKVSQFVVNDPVSTGDACGNYAIVDMYLLLTSTGTC